MAKRNRPVLLCWLGTNPANQNMQRIAARRIVTRGCNVRKRVTISLLAERSSQGIRLGLSFYEKNTQRPKDVFLEGEFDVGDMPPVTLTSQAMTDLFEEPASEAIDDLLAAALSKHCSLVIAMSCEGGSLGVHICLRIGNSLLSLICPHSELPNFLTPGKRLRAACPNWSNSAGG